MLDLNAVVCLYAAVSHPVIAIINVAKYMAGQRERRIREGGK